MNSFDIGFIFGVAVIALVLLVAGYIAGKEEMKAQYVKAGVAGYEITGSGDVKFRFRKDGLK